MGALLFREGAGRPRAIFDRGLRTRLAKLPEATTEDRAERTDAVCGAGRAVVLVVLVVRGAVVHKP